ncbi:HEPN domain-containing protein [Burkholderia anthina]|uniref:ApeA N-terminal domain 1-containing protein n=1 Tax=Burkholderia anthina TaxID=179879 RepID=UPI00158BC2B2|nr:HEPN domain-containing protein [Burkholderia anthina]
MRLIENFEKSGFFWLPSSPEKKVPGTLRILDGGNTNLEIVGSFENHFDSLNTNINIGRIVGHIEGDKLVTLERCFYKTKSLSFGGIAKSSIRANKALIGVSYDDEEEVLINQFQFSVDGIDEWVGISGIKVDRQFESKTSSISYLPPENISITLNDGLRLVITFTWTLPGFPVTTEAKITQKAYFGLVSDEARPLDDFISAAYKITNLVGFSVDKTVCLESVTVAANSLPIGNFDGKPVLAKIALFYASLPYTKERPQIARHEMLFNFLQIRGDWERIINNWFSAYDLIDPALNLYFSTKTGVHKYLDSKFLALAQGLETYHRRTSNEKQMDEKAFESIKELLTEKCPEEYQEWLSGRLRHGNEINLRKRLKRIIEPFNDVIGSRDHQKRLISSIVNTRNYLTHYDQSLEAESSTGIDLWNLCKKMEAIFQLHILQVLGFSPDQIKAIHDNSTELQQKLKIT